MIPKLWRRLLCALWHGHDDETVIWSIDPPWFGWNARAQDRCRRCGRTSGPHRANVDERGTFVSRL